MSIQSLILATLAISALGANLKGTTKQGVEIATADRLIQYDQVVDMTNKDCQNFDSRSGWKIVMGENIDYFKPKAGETLCSALQSTNKFLWSATQNGKYIAPSPYPSRDSGGSATYWPRKNVPGDDRVYLPFWSQTRTTRVTGTNGCCHNTKTDKADWGKKFKIYAILEPDGINGMLSSQINPIQRWVKGAIGSTCDTTCGAVGFMRDSDVQTKLNTNEKVKAAFGMCNSFREPMELAKGKPTKQSSTNGNGNNGNSGKAVDGNSNSNYGAKSCTHTKADRNAWWRVDLGTTRSISTLKIQNRKCGATSACGKRLQKFEIQIGDDDSPMWDDGTNGKQSANWGASKPTRHYKYKGTLDDCKTLCRVDHGKNCKAVEYRVNHECRTFGYSVTRQYYKNDWVVSFLNNNAKCIGTASNAAGLFYPNSVGDGQKVTIECNRPMSGRYVYIQLKKTTDSNSYLTLCEVEVFDKASSKTSAPSPGSCPFSTGRTKDDCFPFTRKKADMKILTNDGWCSGSKSRSSMVSCVHKFDVSGVATEATCLEKAKAEFGDKVIATRTTLISGSWSHVPAGCSVQSGGDWAAHWNSGSGGNDGTYTSVGSGSECKKLCAEDVNCDAVNYAPSLSWHKGKTNFCQMYGEQIEPKVGWTTCGKTKETLKTWPDTGIVIFPTKYKLTCATYPKTVCNENPPKKQIWTTTNDGWCSGSKSRSSMVSCVHKFDVTATECKKLCAEDVNCDAVNYAPSLSWHKGKTNFCQMYGEQIEPTGYCSDYKYMTDGTVQSGKYRVRNTGSCPSSYVESCHATKGCFCSKTKDTCSSWKFDKHYKTVKHVGWTTCGKSKETLKTWPDTGIVIFPTKYKLTCAVLDVESRSTAPLCSCTKDGHVEYLQSKCLVLPGSMNGGKHPRGCPGAVWSNGKPASTYCNGKGGKYPWWKDCCQWKGGSCKPKPVALIQHEPSLAKCLVLPGSMNGGKHPRGCPGAVWSSGSPAGSYCNGKGGKYPWWRDCCQWKDGSCKPKSVAVHQDVVASWDEKKYGKNGVDLVVKYIQRWVKGAVGSTCDTTCGAKGLMCDSDAQTKLNTNEKVKAAFAEAGYTCKSFHPARTYGGTPFSTGRAKDDCTPFLAGAKRSVCDSNPHKNHAPLCSCM